MGRPGGTGLRGLTARPAQAERGFHVPAACALGLEGIVSKRLDKPYSSGRCHARPSGQSPTAEAQIAWAITVTEEAKVAAEEKRDQAQADLDGTRTRLSAVEASLFHPGPHSP